MTDVAENKLLPLFALYQFLPDEESASVVYENHDEEAARKMYSEAVDMGLKCTLVRMDMTVLEDNRGGV